MDRLKYLKIKNVRKRCHRTKKRRIKAERETNKLCQMMDCDSAMTGHTKDTGQIYHAQGKQPGSKGCIVHASVYPTFWKRQNYGAEKLMDGCWVWDWEKGPITKGPREDVGGNGTADGTGADTTAGTGQTSTKGGSSLCVNCTSIFLILNMKKADRSPCCGATGSAASPQRQDAGSIPSLAQWVKGSSVAPAVA